MKLHLNPHLRLGLLGGGQLAWMLALKSQALGLRTSILCPSPEEPAAQVNPNWMKGNPNQVSDLQEFAKSQDLLTFESEFYESYNLTQGLRQFKGILFPRLQALAILQDRLSQKESLVQARLATSPFLYSTTPEEIHRFFRKHRALVAKQRRHGYDGYGTFVLKTEKELGVFLKSHEGNLSSFIFEKWIPFQKELAFQVARSRAGDLQFFPLIETVQKDKKCFYVVGPEKPPRNLTVGIGKWLDRLNYVGVMGIEFFKTGNQLLINEIAPRVHNTGHHTLDSCTVDQFTMHWLCALQDQLPKPELKVPAFVMLNLLGESERPVQFPDQIDGALYWYRKSNRNGRKLGHINWVGKSKRALVHKALSHLKDWKLR
ncbi:MAG: ATP-grasp domain-containing protein [Bdellovibrionales bacterium]